MNWTSTRGKAYWLNRIEEELSVPQVEDLEDEEIEEFIEDLNFRDAQDNIIRG